MWHREWPEVACVRETFEETGLRITVERPLAVFESAHFFLCSLNSPRSDIRLREKECIDHAWVSPPELLRIGTIMDLRRILPILELAGFDIPTIPDGLVTSVPEKVF